MTTLAGRVAVLFASLGFLLVHTSALAQEPSLAEQVAAAKSRSGHEQPTRVMGRTVAGDYQNGALGFQLRHIPGWTSMSRGMMNVDEAMGREALGLQAVSIPLQTVYLECTMRMVTTLWLQLLRYLLEQMSIRLPSSWEWYRSPSHSYRMQRSPMNPSC